MLLGRNYGLRLWLTVAVNSKGLAPLATQLLFVALDSFGPTSLAPCFRPPV